ncbi:MAG: hypothetical protein QMD13_02255 [Candidatus Bathyarchaeia archaeon]|nr:hypothetical protein [Candidatus Bathyarchaeia archaeon]
MPEWIKVYLNKEQRGLLRELVWGEQGFPSSLDGICQINKPHNRNDTQNKIIRSIYLKKWWKRSHIGFVG